MPQASLILEQGQGCYIGTGVGKKIDTVIVQLPAVPRWQVVFARLYVISPILVVMQFLVELIFRLVRFF